MYIKSIDVAKIILQLIDKVYLFFTIFDNSLLYILNEIFANDNVNC